MKVPVAFFTKLEKHTLKSECNHKTLEQSKQFWAERTKGKGWRCLTSEYATKLQPPKQQDIGLKTDSEERIQKLTAAAGSRQKHRRKQQLQWTVLDKLDTHEGHKYLIPLKNQNLNISQEIPKRLKENVCTTSTDTGSSGEPQKTGKKAEQNLTNRKELKGS